MINKSQQSLIIVNQLNIIRNDREIINNLNFELMPEDNLFLCGDIGSGKSTLLHTLLGFIPFTGSINILGLECISEEDFSHIRGKLGLLFQHPDDQLFGPSVLDDIMFGPLNMGLNKEQAKNKALETLELLDIMRLKDRAVTELSGGEKNFTALAGILAMSPKVLLLDEPTNGLNERNIIRLKAILRQLKLPMIVASHDRQFTNELATRIIHFPITE